MNPNVARKVVRSTLANLGTVNWLSIAGQTSFPVRVAAELKIPLIIWGAHQGLEQVGMYSHLDEVEMTSRYRREHDLMGVDEESIFDFDPNFSREDISSLEYPDDATLISHRIRGIYLGNYLRWDPVAQHEFVKKQYGYLGRKSSRTYYEFDNPDCPVYNEFQDYLKQLRKGYGKVTDQLTRDIRHGRISKSQAKKVQKKFQNRLPRDVQNFASWLEIPVGNLNTLLLTLSRNFPESILNQSWKGQIDAMLTSSRGQKLESRRLIDDDYINIGKGI
jgi:hypothetical protein